MAPSRPVARSRVGRKLPPAPLRLAHRCPRGDRNCLLTAQSRFASSRTELPRAEACISLAAASITQAPTYPSPSPGYQAPAQ